MGGSPFRDELSDETRNAIGAHGLCLYLCLWRCFCDTRGSTPERERVSSCAEYSTHLKRWLIGELNRASVVAKGAKGILEDTGPLGLGLQIPTPGMSGLRSHPSSTGGRRGCVCYLPPPTQLLSDMGSTWVFSWISSEHDSRVLKV